MTAYFRKDATPIRTLFTRDGLVQVGENMIQVLRWGLWMSPIINSFLRPMGEPTWYNQDGAVRTVIATFRIATLSPEPFRAWSLQVFIACWPMTRCGFSSGWITWGCGWPRW